MGCECKKISHTCELHLTNVLLIFFPLESSKKDIESVSINNKLLIIYKRYKIGTNKH